MRTVGEQLEADKTENFVNQTLRPLGYASKKDENIEEQTLGQLLALTRTV